MIDGMDKLAEYCEALYTLSEAEALEKEAAEKKKLDPKAKTRNRGDVVFSAESPKVKDNKDHFEVNTKAQAHAALSYAGHYTSAPPWYKGTLEELKSAIRRKVHSKFPGIEISDGKKKKSSLEEVANGLLIRNAQQAPAVQPPAPVPAPGSPDELFQAAIKNIPGQLDWINTNIANAVRISSSPIPEEYKSTLQNIQSYIRKVKDLLSQNGVTPIQIIRSILANRYLDTSHSR